MDPDDLSLGGDSAPSSAPAPEPSGGPAAGREPAPATDSPAPPQKRAPSSMDIIRERLAYQKAKAAGGAPEPRQTADEPPERAAPGRGPDGRFTPARDRPAPDRTPSRALQGPAADAERVAAAAAAQLDATVPDKTGRTVADGTPAAHPPSSWSPTSKVAFDGLPATVKADIAKREHQYEQGMAKLREYAPLDRFAQMARNSGTTLDKALENYVGIENTLRTDLMAGMERLAQGMGFNLRAFAQAYLMRATGHQPAPASPATGHQPAPTPQDMIRLATDAARAEYEAQAAMSDVQRFAADPKNRFFANVQPRMLQLVSSGMAHTVEDAYDMACRLDPEISRLLSLQPPVNDPRRAVDAARAAARATTGAPGPGFTGNGAALPKDASRMQIIRHALAEQKGGRA